MEQELKRINRRLTGSFVGCLLAIVVLIVAFEYDWLPQGALADDGLGSYLWQYASVLFTLGGTYLALYLPARQFRKWTHETIDAVKWQQYAFWAMLRIGLLMATLCVNVCAYYLTMSTYPLLCAGIVLAALVFCLPSRKRIGDELGINKTEEDE